MDILGTVASSLRSSTASMFFIANTTLTSTSNSITFSSVTGYTHLYLLTSTRCTFAATGVDLLITLNGSTSSFSSYGLQANADSAYANSNPGSGRNIANAPGSSATSNYFGIAETYIIAYNNAYNKSLLSKDAMNRGANGAGGAYNDSFNINWANTAAITSVAIQFSSGDLAIGSTATLYGIKNT